MNDDERDDPQAGSTIVELVATSVIIIVAVSMLSANVLPALVALQGPDDSDFRNVEFHVAAEVLARGLRAARPQVTHASVGGDRDVLIMRTGTRGVLTALLTDSALLLTLDGPISADSGFPSGVLIDDLDMTTSGFFFLDHEGVTTDKADETAAVKIRLADAGHTVVRLVHLRGDEHMYGITGW